MFSDKKIYILSFLRLMLIPTTIIWVLKLLGAGDDILRFAFIAFAPPIGMNTIVYPAAYSGDTKTGALMTLVSSVLSIVTILVMYYLLIELL